MNTSRKTLLLLYIAFLVVLFFQWSNRAAIVPPTGIILSTDAPKYTLPKVPTLSVQNMHSTAVTIDTCRDIELVVNGLSKTRLPTSLCRSIDIPPGEKQILLGAEKQDILVLQESFYALQEATSLRFVYDNATLALHSEADVVVKKAGFIRLFFRKVFYDPVYNLFATLILAYPGYSLGLAIVTITLLIRLILLVPQQHMLVSQRKMQTLQPKIKSIQEQHKGDQATIGIKMMELYKKEGVNPFGSILPIFIQIPILIVLYQVILNISLPVNWAHLYDFSWLQQFRNIIPNPHFFGMHLDQSGGVVGIILGVLTGGLQFFQMWLAQRRSDASAAVPKETKPLDPAMPDMQKVQKMMIYIFPAMAALFAYQFPAGVGLYWLIGTIFMIVQQWFANKQAEKKTLVIRDKNGTIIAS